LAAENITTTIEGRERYSINLRYPRDLRANLDQLQRILVTARIGGNMSVGAASPPRPAGDIGNRGGDAAPTTPASSKSRSANWPTSPWSTARR